MPAPASSRGVQTEDAILKSLLDAKGDVITALATDTPVRLARGTDGQALVADAAAEAGVKFADVAATSGGLVPAATLGTGTPGAGKLLRGSQEWAGGVIALADSQLSADAANIDLTGLSQDFAHLRVLGLVRTTVAAVLSSVSITLNGDAGANYHRQTARLGNISFTGVISNSQNEWSLSAVGANGTAGWFAAFDLVLLNYAAAIVHVGQCLNVCMATTTGADIRLENHNLRHIGTTAIDRITVAAPSLNLLAGSRVTVYGLG